MMTRAKAVAFLRGFDDLQLLEWWVTLVDWRWPDDLPFFLKPLPDVDQARSIEEQNAWVADPVWLSLFVALHEVTTHEDRVKALAFSAAMEQFYSQIDNLLHVVANAVERSHVAASSWPSLEAWRNPFAQGKQP